jgi:hypothetical protein
LRSVIATARTSGTTFIELLVDGHDDELWQRARKVAKFDRKK